MIPYGMCGNYRTVIDDQRIGEHRGFRGGTSRDTLTPKPTLLVTTHYHVHQKPSNS